MLKEILKDSQGVPTGLYKDIAGGTLWADSPIGTILAYGGTSAPSGWMICDGTSLLRASYPELFAVIGTAFGSADSTHFNIPDMRESVPKGAGLTSKSNNHMDADGLAVGEFIDDRIKSHSHTINTYNEGTYAGNKVITITGDNLGALENIDTIANGSATNEVKSVGVNYIIKAKMVAVPADFMDKVDEAVEDVYGDIIPSDASASNKLTTSEETWIGRGVLGIATDLNTIVIPGCYDCPDASLLTNAPSGAGRGKLINFYGGNNTMYFSQMYRNIDDGGTWVRSSAGTWSSWEKLVTESDLAIKKKDISATGGATSFSTTIPLSMAQRNKPFYLEVLSVGNSNAIKEMKYRVFVSSINTNVTTQEISKDSNFTNVSITFDASTGYVLSFSSTETLYSTTVYTQQ